MSASRKPPPTTPLQSTQGAELPKVPACMRRNIFATSMSVYSDECSIECSDMRPLGLAHSPNRCSHSRLRLKRRAHSFKRAALAAITFYLGEGKNTAPNYS